MPACAAASADRPARLTPVGRVVQRLPVKKKKHITVNNFFCMFTQDKI